MEFADFCQAQGAWREQVLDLEHGYRSHDTLGRVFARLHAVSSEDCFLRQLQERHDLTKGPMIEIDRRIMG